METKVFYFLLELVMCSDPWPVVDDDGENERMVKAYLDTEAQVRGYDSWVDAYMWLAYGDTSEQKI